MKNWEGTVRGDQDLTTPVSRVVPIGPQALSGMHLFLVYLKYNLVLPLQAMQRENFSYFFSVPSCTGYWFYFWVFLLIALYWFSLALCLFLLSSKDQTINNLQQFSWFVVPDCRPVSYAILYIFFLYHGVSSHREKQEKEGWLEPCLSLSTVIFICSSYFFFPSRNLQCRFKNSCGVFLKILFWIKEN